MISQVTLTEKVDYETGPHIYRARVRASDRGTPFRRQTEKIFTVGVQNVNDNPPLFESDNCNGYVAMVS